MRRKKRENFTRRRCWWSKRRDEKGVRDSETKEERQTDKGWEKETEWDTEKGGISRENIHMRDRERKKREHKACFSLDHPSHP